MMCKNFDCKDALNSLSKWLDDYKVSDGKKCVHFFSIISIRLALTLFSELLRRVEELENTINFKND